MNEKIRVSVDQTQPTPYLEGSSWMHKFKRRLTYRDAFKLLRRYFAGLATAELLEIGTGAGYFLLFFHETYRSAGLSGLEYDERLLEATRIRAPFADCRQGNAECFDFDGKRFDVVVSFQVIEHLYAPMEMLKSVHAQLKPGGVFLFTTPNVNCFAAKVMGGKWHGYRSDHVSMKGFSEWKRLVESAGFEALYCGSTFFSGVPVLNRFPLGVVNWLLLVTFGSLQWSKGESFVGVFRRL